MKQPSTKLLDLLPRRFGEPVSEVSGELNNLFEFEATKNLGYVDPTLALKWIPSNETSDLIRSSIRRAKG
jgi:hypothetical protein